MLSKRARAPSMLTRTPLGRQAASSPAPVLDLDLAVAQRSVHLDAAVCIERQLDLGLAAGGDAHAGGSARVAPIVRVEQRQQREGEGEGRPVGARDHGSPINPREAVSISKCLSLALASVIYFVW